MAFDWDSFKENVLTDSVVGVVYGTISAIFLKLYKKFVLWRSEKARKRKKVGGGK